MPAFSVQVPRSAADWHAYYELRWRILRAPWQADGEARDASDERSTHRMLVCNDTGRVIAVGRIHRLDEHPRQGQIRYMAVEQGYERRGHGSRLLLALEQAAREMALETVILHAREQALPFYRHHGYTLVEPSFLLFDAIQHYLMNKRIPG